MDKMIKFKSIIVPGFDTYENVNEKFFGRKEIVHKDVYIHKDAIVFYEKVEKENDKECVRLNLKHNDIKGYYFPRSFVVCKKDDEDAYNKLMK
jgi:hypothetical protein